MTQVFGRVQLNQEKVFDEKQNKSTWVCFRVFLGAFPNTALIPAV